MSVSAGAHVDTPVASVAVETVLGHLASIDRSIARLVGPPVNVNPVASLVSQGNTPTVVSVGGPDASHLWQLQRISLGPAGAGSTLAASGTLVVYRDMGAGGSGGVELTRTTILPNDAEWGHGQIVIKPPSSLWLYWVSGNPGDTLIADVQCLQLPLADLSVPVSTR